MQYVISRLASLPGTWPCRWGWCIGSTRWRGTGWTMSNIQVSSMWNTPSSCKHIPAIKKLQPYRTQCNLMILFQLHRLGCTLNMRIIYERWIGKNMEGMQQSVSHSALSAFSWRNWGTQWKPCQNCLSHHLYSQPRLSKYGFPNNNFWLW
jgi:hypothetical protein